MKRGQLEWQLLVLVTLGLVAFGLVMVYSATSASAALGDGDPMYYLKRQAIYAVLGLVAARRRLALRLPPAAARSRRRSSSSRSRCSALPCSSSGGASTAPAAGSRSAPAAFQPSELAKLALASGSPRISRAAGRRRRSASSRSRSGCSSRVFCALVLVEPDLGTAIAIVVMVGGDAARRRARRLRVLGGGDRDRRRARLARDLARAVPARALLQLPRPVERRAGRRLPDVQALIGLGSGGIFGGASARASRRSTTSPRRTPT